MTAQPQLRIHIDNVIQKSHSRVTIFSKPGLSVPALLNAAALANPSSHYLFLDEFVEINAEGIEAMLETSQEYPIVGPKLVRWDDTVHSMGYEFVVGKLTRPFYSWNADSANADTDAAYPLHRFQGHSIYHPKSLVTSTVKAVSKACMLVTHDAFKTGFNTDFESNYFDVDFCLKSGPVAMEADAVFQYSGPVEDDTSYENVEPIRKDLLLFNEKNRAIKTELSARWSKNVTLAWNIQCQATEQLYEAVNMIMYESAHFPVAVRATNHECKTLLARTLPANTAKRLMIMLDRDDRVRDFSSHAESKVKLVTVLSKDPESYHGSTSTWDADLIMGRSSYFGTSIPQNWGQSIASSIDYVIIPTDSQLKSFEASQVNASRLITFPTRVDLNMFNPDFYPEGGHYPLPNKKKLNILMVGSWDGKLDMFSTVLRAYTETFEGDEDVSLYLLLGEPSPSAHSFVKKLKEDWNEPEVEPEPEPETETKEPKELTEEEWDQKIAEHEAGMKAGDLETQTQEPQADDPTPVLADEDENEEVDEEEEADDEEEEVIDTASKPKEDMTKDSGFRYPEKIEVDYLQGFIVEDKKRQSESRGIMPQIVLLEEFVPRAMMPTLLASVQVYLHMKRGEQTLLPIMEATAMDLTVVATHLPNSSHVADWPAIWLEHDRLVPIPYDPDVSGSSPTGQWGQPSVELIRQGLQRVKDGERTQGRAWVAQTVAELPELKPLIDEILLAQPDLRSQRVSARYSYNRANPGGGYTQQNPWGAFSGFSSNTPAAPRADGMTKIRIVD